MFSACKKKIQKEKKNQKLRFGYQNSGGFGFDLFEFGSVVMCFEKKKKVEKENILKQLKAFLILLIQKIQSNLK